jgi:hypothetical protein
MQTIFHNFRYDNFRFLAFFGIQGAKLLAAAASSSGWPVRPLKIIILTYDLICLFL